MSIVKNTVRVSFLLALVSLAGCSKKVAEDPCMKSQWAQAKEYEVKLAVDVLPSSVPLPGGTDGSLYPEDFRSVSVTGTIQKEDCGGVKYDLCDLGYTNLTKGVDTPAQIDAAMSYWIGYIVYVYQMQNDQDRLNVRLTVKITMEDEQSYMCNITESVYSSGIKIVQGAMYYYVLIDIYSDNWVKV
jgi:hypothetical protein